MEKKTSKKLRARLAKRAKKAKDPMVRKRVGKDGKVQVSWAWYALQMLYQHWGCGKKIHACYF
jgi:hypothetical protein